jgi:drug/metabolite transporter (DMT)-like permease
MNNNNNQNFSIPILILAICAVSTAAPLAKIATDVHPIAIGFWRTFLVGLVLIVTTKPYQWKISKKNWLLVAAAGILLALHFWSWFASLRYTSALRSTTLVCLNPVWAGIMEQFILRNSPPKKFWAGVLVALVGVALMTSGDLSEGAITGDLLALLGGLLGAAYLIVGRVARQDMKINVYGGLICLFCALVLGLISYPLPAPLYGYTTISVVALLAMAIGPQLTGHIGLNYCVRYISAASISLALLLEPVGAAILAAIFLEEYPSQIEIFGSSLILVGVGIGSIKRR